jgi:transposase
VVEQRYRAVMEVVAGASVVEVAERYRVSRQSVHAWLRRYEAEGLAGLEDRSRRPRGHPAALAGEVEALISELRRARRWGPRRLEFELARREYRVAPRRSIGSWSATISSSPRPAAADGISTCAGSGRSRCSCGSWMSPPVCSWWMAAS